MQGVHFREGAAPFRISSSNERLLFRAASEFKRVFARLPLKTVGDTNV
jgi:hypothetical protein